MWIIYGLRYDLTEWAAKHPGGSAAIEYSRGIECTVLFKSYHSLSDRNIRAMIKPFLHPDQSDIPLSVYDWDQTSGFYSAFTKRVKAYFATNRLSHKTSFLRWLLLATIFLSWLYCYMKWLEGRWGGMLAMPIMYWLCGSYCMHGGGHWSMSKKPWVNFVARLFGSFHLAPHTWMLQHTIGHHQYTNHAEKDPDLNHFRSLDPGFRLHREHPWKESYRSWLTALNFEPIATIVGPGLLLQLSYYIEGMIMKVVPVVNFSTFDLLCHVLNRALYVYMFGYLPFVNLAWYKALVFIIVPATMHGVIFYAFSQISHLTAECFGDVGIEGHREWAVQQVRTARDYSTRSNLWNIISIGLNQQVLHHLLPQVDSCHYLALQPILEQTLREFGIEYSVYESWHEAYMKHRQYVRSLNDPEATLVKQFVEEQGGVPDNRPASSNTFSAAVQGISILDFLLLKLNELIFQQRGLPHKRPQHRE